MAIEKNRPSAALEQNGQLYYTEINTYMQWILGYITATQSLMDKNSPMAVDFYGIALWIKKYAAENPSKTIYEAANAFCRANGLSIERPAKLKTTRKTATGSK
jgi:hypothetical protein